MKHMKKILFMSMMIMTFWGISYTSTYALSVSQALAQAQAAAAQRPWAVVHGYNPLTWQVTWWCTNGAVRWTIPATPEPPTNPKEPGKNTTVKAGICSSYIASWGDSWSACDINSYWTPGWTITCKQTHSWVPNHVSCWQIERTYSSTWALLSETCNTSDCWVNVPSPTTVIPNHIVNIGINDARTFDGPNGAYANNLDTNDIQISIIANGILWGNTVSGWENPLYGIPGKITDLSATWWTVAANRITKTWESALNFSQIQNTNIAWWGNNYVINVTWIKSYAPLFINDGTLSFKAGWVPIVRNNIVYHFKKPFTWKIDIYDFVKKSWSGASQVGTNQQYRVVGTNNKNISISDYKITDFTNQILPWDENNHFVSTKSVSGVTLKNQDGVIFYATLNTSTWAKSLGEPRIKIQTPIINYTFWGKKVSYYLNAEDEWDNFAPLFSTNSQEFIWVRVIGWIQWGWKSEFTWQKANISNLYNSDMRTQVRKNAYNYVKNMSSGQILNGVKYVKWNTTISGNLDYETLVVVDGNVIINGDLNSADKSLWIIVLKDNYDVNTDYAWQGNIYITPNVKQINAIMYSDGAFISANSAGQPYIKDTIDRTEKLQTQLFMKGSLFTRNTIWGAILAGGNYILPGGTKIQTGSNDFEKAMIYDLNYIRRWNIWCDKSTPKNEKCNDVWEYSDPFIIKYDPRIQTTPPKLFSY